MLLVAEIMPATSDSIPLIGQSLCVCVREGLVVIIKMLTAVLITHPVMGV